MVNVGHAAGREKEGLRQGGGAFMLGAMTDQGKAVIVTGAGRGIGREISLELARAGYSVALVARTGAQIESVAQEILDEAGAPGGVRALALPADVTDPAAVEDAVGKTVEAFGGIEALVNNAGRFQAIGPTWETDPERFWGDITINVRGPYLMCRAAIPHMLKAGRGTIINMIGGGTGNPNPYGNAYGTSKAALMRFTETLAAELKEEGISVFATNPGLVRTEMTEYQLITEEGKRWMRRMAQAFDDGVDRPPTDAARLIRRLVEGDYFALTGRRFGPADAPAEVLADIDRIVKEDLRTLRLT